MTYRDSLYFTFDGESSDLYNIINVNLESGMLEEEFLSNRSIKSVSIKGRPNSYFQDVEYSPRKINVTFAIEDYFDTDLLQRISRWLFQDYYKQLVFSSHPERVYYAILDGESSIFHNAAQQGYIKLTFLCDSPFTYSPVYNSTVYDYTSNTTDGTVYKFHNDGDMVCNPILIITKIGNGDVRIVNASNGGREFSITGLLNNEVVTINNEAEDIVTNIPMTYRFDNHNGVFIEIVKGINTLIIYGNCKLQWLYEYRYYA